mgnify:CR=1 FL=1
MTYGHFGFLFSLDRFTSRNDVWGSAVPGGNLDYDVCIDLVPLVDFRYETSVASGHRLWNVDLGLDPDDLLLVVRELVRYVDVVDVALTCDVREYQREDLRLGDVLVPSEGVEPCCKEAVFVDHLVIEVNRYELLRSFVRSDPVAFGQTCDYRRYGTDVFLTCDRLRLEDP